MVTLFALAMVALLHWPEHFVSPMSNHNRDGSKRSFAELDKLRRERKQGGGDQPRSERGADAQSQKNYRAALERAFDSGRLAEFAASMQRAREPEAALPRATPAPPEIDSRLAPAQPDTDDAAAPDTPAPRPRQPLDPEVVERKKMVKQILQATSPRDAAKAIDRYLERHGELPRDLDILEKALSHAKARVVLHALERLAAWIAKEKPRRSRSLAVQLAIIEDTHEDTDIRALAAQVRASL
jgi:hypothetical protein